MNTLSDLHESFLDYLASSSQVRPNTLRAYRYELLAASAHFRGPLDKLTLSDLEAWVSRQPAAPSTIGRRAAALSRFFKWAVRHDLCESNLLDGREPIRSTRHLPRPIRSETEQAALDAAIAHAPQPYHLIFTLLRETGMRVGEALGLRRSDVTLEAGRESLRVREAKNSVERMVILGPTATPRSLRALRAHLKAMGKAQPHEFLFISNRGTRISYDATHYQWARLCEQAGLTDESGKPRYSIHQLRHTRGSELLAQGQGIEVVQRVLGHRDIRSTLLYAQLDDAQLRAALERPSR